MKTTWRHARFMSVNMGFVLCGALAVSAASPKVSLVQPPGGQRGVEHELTISGDRLQDAVDLFFYKPGISLVEIKAEDANGKQIKAKVKIAPDCGLGEHPLRVRTKSGVSELFTFQVGAYPDVAEVEPNSDFAAPRKIPMNATVSGLIKVEDVDFFAVEAKKGQRITAEIEAVRLGVMLLDPHVTIFDTNRFELAVNDDSTLLLQDSLASVVAPADGTYIIQVRESSYGGHDSLAQYRLHVGTYARPTVTYPLGGNPGQKISVKFLGDVQGAYSREVTLPGESGAWTIWPGDAAQPAPSPISMRVSALADVLETEPNNTRQEAVDTAKELPLAVNGIIQADGDQDWFKFTAKKGQNFHVECYARRLRSPLDAIVDIYDDQGKRVVGNDDSRGADSYVNFKPPADGEYTVKIRDHLGKGGEEYVYRIEFEPVKPTLAFNMPIFQNNTQERQYIAVPRGNRFGTTIDAKRDNFGGDLKVIFEGLPAGVTCSVPVMPSNMTRVPVVFEATTNAVVSGALVGLTGEHVDPAQQIKGTIEQDVNLVYANPNNTVYYKTTVDKFPLAVTDEVPFSLRIESPKVPLVHGGFMNLKVIADRKDGFDQPIKVYMLYNPPGIGSANVVTIAKDQPSADYRLNANGQAGDRVWPLAVIGSATVNGGTVWVSSPFVDLQVTTPYVSGAIEMAALEQGKDGEILCKLNQLKPFEGEAKIRLVGLPAKVVTEEKSITKETKEIVFEVTTEAETPRGQHKSLFCSVDVPQAGEVIAHSIAGGGVLRIDPPPPAPKKPAPKPAPQQAAKVEPEKKPEKRLSRLEKLRLLQKERTEASGG